MEGILKLTYTNGWAIGLGTQGEHYYAFWGKTDAPLMDNEVTVYDNIMHEHNTYIKIPFSEDKGRYFTMVLLDNKEDFKIAERVLKAVLLNEQSTY